MIARRERTRSPKLRSGTGAAGTQTALMPAVRFRLFAVRHARAEMAGSSAASAPAAVSGSFRVW